MKSIVTLIVPNPQHDPHLEPPHYPPLLCTDTHLEMVLHHHIAHHNHLVLHLEVDQKKGLCLHQDLVVGLILKLESMRWHTHQRDTLQIPDIRAYKDHLKKL